jgi:hypothetical protein
VIDQVAHCGRVYDDAVDSRAAPPFVRRESNTLRQLSTGFATFPGEIWQMPRSWAEKSHPNLTAYTDSSSTRLAGVPE